MGETLKRLGLFSKRFANAILIASAVAGIIAVWLQYRSQRSPQIEVLISNVERLPPQARDSDIKMSLSFKGRVLENLWILRLKIRNSGGPTIIFSGHKANVMNPSITLDVSSGFQILDIKKESSSFPCDVSFESSRLKLIGKQWRSEEAVQLLIYLTAQQTDGEEPNFLSKKRDLIDGDVVVNKSTDISQQTKKKLFDYLPRPLVATLRWISAAILCVLFLGIILAFSNEQKKNPEPKKWTFWFGYLLVYGLVAIGIAFALLSLLL